MRTLNYIDPFISHSEDWVDIYPFGIHERQHNQGVSATKKAITVDEWSESVIPSTGKKESIDFRSSNSLNTLVKYNDQEMPAQVESLLAAAIVKAIPSFELVNSGIKAVNDAIRLARAFTGKSKIIQFEGAIHDDIDKSQSLRIPFNSKDAVEETFAKHGEDIAAILVEPVLSAGVIVPATDYLQFLRNMATKHQSILIFDESISGFRYKLSGAQGYFRVIPDLTILGGGFPVGVIGGKHHIMTLAGVEPTETINKTAALSALTTLKSLSSPLFYETLNHRSRDFIHCLKEITSNKGLVVNSFYSMFSLAFSEKELTSYDDVKTSDMKRFDRFTSKLRDESIYLSSSPAEANFISMAHVPAVLNRTLEAVYKVMKQV